MADQDTTVPQNGLAIELSDGMRFNFTDYAEATAWLEKEQKSFQWLIEGGAQAGAGISNLRGTYVKGFNQFRSQLNQWNESTDKAQIAEAIKNTFIRFYSNSNVLHSNHEFARIASAVAEQQGAIAASAAFGTLMGVDCDVNYQTIKGIIAATLTRNGIDPKSPDIVVKTIADLNSSSLEDRRNNEAEWNRLIADGSVLLANTSEAFNSQASKLRIHSEETFSQMNEAVNASLTSIKQTEATYKEQMKLQAPVEYWEQKAAKHRLSLHDARRNIILFAILGTLALIVGLVCLTLTAVGVAGSASANTAIFLKFAAIGAIITTIAFWIGRVLLRIYLSDRHLLTDAEERIALIQTYLSLSNDDKVDTSDRALILAPLFRTASDGIVKEDGPDASIAGLMAKLLDLRPGK